MDKALGRQTAISVSSLFFGIGWLTIVATQAAINWNVHWIRTNPSPQLSAVAYGNDRFIAITPEGDNFQASASDPENWTQGERIGDGSLSSFLFANGTFVAIGFDRTGTNAVRLTSTDGANWSQRNVPTLPALREIAYGNGQFVGIGDYVIVTSPDAITWNPAPFVPRPHAIFYSINFENGEFIVASTASGMTSRFAISRDGIEWLEHGEAWAGITDLAFGRNLYVALGQSDCGASCDTIHVVRNARSQHWPSQETTPPGIGASRIAYGSGYFAATAGPMLLTSLDGIRWDTFSIVSFRYLYEIIHGNNRFVAIGPGVIAVSEQLEFLPIIGGARIEGDFVAFELDAPDGTVWQIQGSDDLSEWEGIGTVTGDADGQQSFRTAMDGKPFRFLRAKGQ